MACKNLLAMVAIAVLICAFSGSGSADAAQKSVILEDQIRSQDLSKSVPALLNYQGFLADASDSAGITVSLEMTFRIFEAESKGAELWSETHSAVEISGGLFQVLLGSVAVFPNGLFDGSQLWLQTEVGAETLMPRKQLVSVVYSQKSGEADHAANANLATEAQHAVHADTAAYSPSASPWSVSGDDIYRQTGKVGIGTVSPLTELDITGSVNATTYYGDGSNLTGITGTADADWAISGDNVYHTMGKVGIGTADTDTSNRLHVVQDCDGPNHAAIYAHAFRSTSPTFGSMYGIYGSVDAADVGGAGVCGYATSTEGYAEVFGVTGATDASDGYGVYGQNAQSGNFGYLGGGYVTSMLDSINNGVYGASNHGHGVYGISTWNNNYGFLGGQNHGIHGTHGMSGNYGFLGSSDYGVLGYHAGSNSYGYLGSIGYGVYGWSDNSDGVRGHSMHDDGVYGISDDASGVFGVAGSPVGGEPSAGVVGSSSSGIGMAGYSNGSTVPAIVGGHGGDGPCFYAGSGGGYPSLEGLRSDDGMAVAGFVNGGTGIYGSASQAGGVGVYGRNYSSDTGGNSYGVQAERTGPSGHALYALMDHTATSPSEGYGIYAVFDCDTSGITYLNSKSALRTRSASGSANKNYLFGISGEQYTSTPRRGGGVLGVYSSARWGCLAYTSSGDIPYGAYFTSYASGTGKTGIGFGSSGELLGGWVSGELYGLYTSGERYASYTDGNSYSNGYAATLHDANGPERIATFTPTTMDVDVYAHGIGRLDEGSCSIAFQDAFNTVISEKIPVTVTVTPMGPCQQLYLESADKGGFVVRESGQGKSSVKFSWIAIGRRKGFESRPQIPKELIDPQFDANMGAFAFNEADLEHHANPMWYDGQALRWDAPPSSYLPAEKLHRAEQERLERERAEEKNQKILEDQKKLQESMNRFSDRQAGSIPMRKATKSR